MDVTVSHFVNFGFTWFLVLLAIVGYFLTLRRIGEKWFFWIILAAGWAILAIAYTLVIAGVPANRQYLATLWILSYVLVAASLILVFVKFIQLAKAKHQNQPTESNRQVVDD